MAPKVAERIKRPSRQRKRRRTDPEDISSPSSSSSSESESSPARRTTTDQRATRASPKHRKIPAERKESYISDSHERKHNVATSMDNYKGANDNVPVSAKANENDSEERLSVAPSRDDEPSSSSTNVAPVTSAQPTTPAKLDSNFESWYLRAVTSQFDNDLDLLRLEAADFKARPRESVAMLSRSLRQGVAAFGQDDRKLIMGVGDDGRNRLTRSGK